MTSDEPDETANHVSSEIASSDLFEPSSKGDGDNPDKTITAAQFLANFMSPWNRAKMNVA